ncbi:SAVED domain-containing protein [Sutcliffiella deserti]|uniref:SAVED domain-containing protein n=1 Tax=Sutcliffiella deserti TaxID=2875501 RepID=UPI001CBF253E|nr:SAVED domain-containing protein [Sutcliffiella deserti]
MRKEDLKKIWVYEVIPIIKHWVSYYRKRKQRTVPLALGIFILTDLKLLLSNYFIGIYNDRSVSGMEVPLFPSSSIWIEMAGFALVVFSIYLSLQHAKEAQITELIILKHSSLYVADHSKENLDSQSIYLNQIEEMKEVSKENVLAALQKQYRAKKQFDKYSEVYNKKIKAYEGIAHIPLVFLLGVQLSDKKYIRFFEWRRHAGAWKRLNPFGFTYPELLLKEESPTAFPDELKEEVVITVSLTFNIKNEQFRGWDLDICDKYHLHLKERKRDAIVSELQLSTYKNQFQELIDTIHEKYPNLKKMHIFISAQPSLVFTLGSCISTKNNADTWVYDYYKGVYPWRLLMHKESEGNSGVVQFHAEKN